MKPALTGLKTKMSESRYSITGMAVDGIFWQLKNRAPVRIPV
jgi:hypothetical protein